MKQLLPIDVYFDFICPWCLIGKRQLQRATAMLNQHHPEIQVHVRWHGVQLLTYLPADGVPFDEFYLDRLGSQTAVEQRQEQVRQAAKAVGVNLDFKRIHTMPNTAKAHHLFAKLNAISTSEQTEKLLERLFSGYFHYAENIGQQETLHRIALECGFDAEQLKVIWQTPNLADISRYRAGHGVPYFIIDGRFAVAGASAAEHLYRTMCDALGINEVAS